MRSNTKICVNHGILWYATIMHTILLKCIMHVWFRRVLKVNAVKLSAFNLASIYKRPKLQNIKTLYIFKVLLYFIYLSHSTKRELNRYRNYNMILSVLLHEKYMKKKRFIDVVNCGLEYSGLCVLELTNCYIQLTKVVTCTCTLMTISRKIEKSIFEVKSPKNYG